MTVPIELPGESEAPALIVVAGKVPLPPTVAPGATEMPLADASEPFTVSVPSRTVTGPA